MSDYLSVFLLLCLRTVASALSSLAAVTSEDLLTSTFNIKIKPENGAMIAKWMSLGYGVLSFVLVFLVERLGGVLQATLTLNGLIGGVTLGLFSLGIFFKKSNSKGALIGGLSSLLVVVFIGINAQINAQETIPLPTSVETCNCIANVTFVESEMPADE